MMYPFYYRRPYRAPYKNYYKNPNTFTPPNINSPRPPIGTKPLSPPPQPDNLGKKSTSSNNNVEYFEILGFKLFYDDLIIIGLILLLFEEKVDDTFLIIALVLLIGD